MDHTCHTGDHQHASCGRTLQKRCDKLFFYNSFFQSIAVDQEFNDLSRLRSASSLALLAQDRDRGESSVR